MINQVNLYSNIQIPKVKRIDSKKENRHKSNFLPSTNHFYCVPFLGKKEVSRIMVLSSIENQKPFSETGFKGIVYKLENSNGSYAIKVARTSEFSFEKEAEILKRVPKKLIGSQKYVDYFKDPKTNRDILVSTLAKGERGVLSTDNDFEIFFNNLLLLDINGVYHGDLNMENCLFNGNSINLIDFGEGSFFQLGETYDEMYPSFMLKSNACNLEQNGIPDCIKEWKNMGLNLKDTFKKYLIAKGKFYSKHSALLDKKTQENAVFFEQNLAKVLANPNNDIIENELRRIDLLYTFEHADTAVNYKRIPEMGIRNWNLTVKKAKLMLSFITQTLKKPLNEDERTYFKYQKQIAEKLLETYIDWGNSTIDWIKESMEKDSTELSKHEKDFRTNQGNYMEPPPDLCSIILN